jgi:Uma2 family endonuclease
VQTTTAQTETTLISGEELLAMGDVGPCELIDGRIVPMSPTGGRHAIVESRLGSTLGFFVQQHKLTWRASEPCSVHGVESTIRLKQTT